jgi:L-iditol 2-dehydrogenase
MTTLPVTMRASVLLSAGVLEVQDLPLPTLVAGDVLVEIAAVGLCGSDVHFYRNGKVGDLVVTEPLVLGHEAAGTIVAVHDERDSDRIGQRVAIDPQRPCRRCSYCRSGAYNLCVDMRFASAPPENGAFAEYLAVPADFAHPVPDGMSDSAAALLEPLSVGIAAVRKARVVPGSRVLVAGAGPIGVLTAAAARCFGAVEVVVVDPLESRLAIAREHGATVAIAPDQLGSLPDPFDAFVDASGARPAIDAGLRALRPGGRAVLVGMGATTIELDMFLLQSRELIVEGLFRYTETWPVAVELVASGAVRLDDLVSGRGGLEDLADLIERNGDPDVMKLIVDPRR